MPYRMKDFHLQSSADLSRRTGCPLFRSEEMLRLVPTMLKEAGSGLGAPRWQVMTKLCYRAAGPGIMTGVLLAMARITGETAPL
ncbi:ABC transporter permease subunit, partial [Endozoicomonas sp.]|uniref:ABC transporter permease subunit n=1 Tax=Endozoicomonas sp. TaxID=1892382 RepID=UPI00383A5A3F